MLQTRGLGRGFFFFPFATLRGSFPFLTLPRFLLRTVPPFTPPLVDSLRPAFFLDPMPPIALAQTDAEIAACFPVMAQLRPHLSADDFASRVRRMQSAGFHLAYHSDEHGTVRCVAGYRIMDLLFSGLTLYVDDLVTDSASRSQGFGDRMIDWLVARAREAGCSEFSLDSGTQRVDAHRFYLRKRLKISAFHFSLPLTS